MKITSEHLDAYRRLNEASEQVARELKTSTTEVNRRLANEPARIAVEVHGGTAPGTAQKLAAHQAGLKSLTVPAVGTGFASALGFGMSMNDSVSGFAQGFKRFVDTIGGVEKTPLRHVDFNIYAQPTGDNAREVADMLAKAGVPQLVK